MATTVEGATIFCCCVRQWLLHALFLLHHRRGWPEGPRAIEEKAVVAGNNSGRWPECSGDGGERGNEGCGRDRRGCSNRGNSISTTIATRGCGNRRLRLQPKVGGTARVAFGRRAAVIERSGSSSSGGERGNEGHRWPGSYDAGEGKQGALFLSHHSRSRWRFWQRRCGGDRAAEKQRQ